MHPDTTIYTLRCADCSFTWMEEVSGAITPEDLISTIAYDDGCPRCGSPSIVIHTRESA